MNRNRFNQMRSMDRGQEQGLQQILQPTAGGHLSPGQGGSSTQQTMRRKTTYTRTELLCRGLPTTQIPRRSPRNRGTTAHHNTVQAAAPPLTPLPPTGVLANTNATSSHRQRSYLPRVTRLQQMATANKNPNASRVRVENDLKAEPVKKTPRLPNTPYASDSNIPGPPPGPVPALGRSFRPEGCGIPMLNRPRNREQPRERDTNERIEAGENSRSSSPMEAHQVKKVSPIRLPVDPKNKSFVYLCKPVKKVKELLTARRMRGSNEHLELAGFGEEDGNEKMEVTSEDLLHSKAAEQGLHLSSITEMSVSPASSSTSQMDDQSMGSHFQPYLCQKDQRQMEMDQVCQNLPTLQHEIRLLQQLNEKLETTLRVSSVPASMQKSAYDIDGHSSTVFYTPRCGPMLFMEMPLVHLSFILAEQVARVTHRTLIVAFAYNVGVVQEFRIETRTLNELKASDETQCFYLPASGYQSKIKEQQAREDRVTPESNPPPLRCTNLRMLRENPSVLIKQLRRGGSNESGQPFSVLDQDVFMFLNSLSKRSEEGFLYSSLSAGIPAKQSVLGYQPHHQYQYQQQPQPQPQYEYQHHLQFQHQNQLQHQLQLQSQTQHQSHPQSNLPELPPKKIFEQVNSTTQTEDVPQNNGVQIQVKAEKESRKLQQQHTMLVTTTTRKARTIKRSPIQSNVEPKVRMKLFKTVLVGLVQVAIFLVLIMAFIYPDVSC